MNPRQLDIQEKVNIRLMREDDLPAVKEIDKTSFSLPWPPSAFEYELNDNPRSMLWVAEIETPETGKLVVGMVVIWLILDEAHIATIAVAPEYRQQEIGKKMLSTALSAVADLNICIATLEVRANNIAAINLYRSFGFEVAGIRPKYYHDNSEDGLIMTTNNLDLFKQKDQDTLLDKSIAGGEK